MSNKIITKLILGLLLVIVCMIYLEAVSDSSHEKRVFSKLGYIDLTNKDLDKNIIILDGQWEFYPDKFLIKDFNKGIYINVPGNWKNFSYSDNKCNIYNYATYRLKLKVPNKKLYCLYIRFIPSAYKLFINNKEVVSNGVIGNSPLEEVATWKSTISSFYSEDTYVDMVIQVSSYHNNKAGIVDSVILGSLNNVTNYYVSNVIKSAVIMGVFVGLSIYLFLLYKSENGRYTFLYLGLFCVSSLVIESIVDAGVIYFIFKNISFNVISKLEYISYILCNISLQLFIRSIYSKESDKLISTFTNIVNFGYLLLIILTPYSIFAYTDMIYICILVINYLSLTILLIKAIKNKRKFAMLLLLGIGVMIFSIIIDVLFIRNYSVIKFTSHNFIVGILFFLICEIYVLSVSVNDAFEASSKAKDMEIAFLQAQISPHFFFNTLNNIHYLIDQSTHKAKSLIIDFCEFLRVKHKFDYRENIFYSLEEEIELIKSYVRIENSRFNGSIDLNIKIDEEYMSVLIPPLLIQPIIENSIRHGLSGNKLNIIITATKKEDKLHIVVSDNGKGIGKDLVSILNNDINSLPSIGLKNVNFRLMKCYNSQLRVISKLLEGTSVLFEISLEVQA